MTALLVGTILLQGCTSQRQQTNLASHLSDQPPGSWQISSLGDEALPVITAQHRDPSTASGPLLVYIEGDGRAWINRRTPSDDPTPYNPLALSLAKSATSAYSTAYIARPCQFAARSGEACRPQLWTFERYSQAVVDTTSQALDQLQRSEGQRLVLVGYSGGGVIAALLAAQRNDVAAFITVAANLDTAAWTALHEVSPLTGSLNPAEVAPALTSLPQRHFVGAGDENVPASVVGSYLQAAGLDPSGHLVEVNGFDHRCCWVENWPQLLAGAMADLKLTSANARPAETKNPAEAGFDDAAIP